MADARMLGRCAAGAEGSEPAITARRVRRPLGFLPRIARALSPDHPTWVALVLALQPVGPLVGNSCRTQKGGTRHPSSTAIDPTHPQRGWPRALAPARAPAALSQAPPPAAAGHRPLGAEAGIFPVVRRKFSPAPERRLENMFKVTILALCTGWSPTPEAAPTAPAPQNATTVEATSQPSPAQGNAPPDTDAADNAVTNTPAQFAADSSTSKAPSRDDRVSELEAQADTAVAAGHHLAAAQLYGELYELEPVPAHLWAKAQLERVGGGCKAAISSYTRYIAATPKPSDAAIAAAQRHVESCRATLRGEAAELDAKEDPRAYAKRIRREMQREQPQRGPIAKTKKARALELRESRLAALAALPPPPDSPLLADPAAVWVGVAGLSFTGTSSIVLGHMFRANQRKLDAGTYFEFNEEWNTAQRARRAWPILMGLGSGLILGSVIRYVVLGSERRKVKKARRQLIRALEATGGYTP